MKLLLKLQFLSETSLNPPPSHVLLSKDTSLDPTPKELKRLITEHKIRVGEFDFNIDPDTICARGLTEPSLIIECSTTLLRESAHMIPSLIRSGCKPKMPPKIAIQQGYILPESPENDEHFITEAP